MALANAVQGALRPGQMITWKREDGTAEPLAGATLTGVIRSRTAGARRAIAGSLTPTDAAGGVFLWEYAAADVAEAGHFDVQFTASFAAGLSPARSFVERWTVVEALA